MSKANTPSAFFRTAAAAVTMTALAAGASAQNCMEQPGCYGGDWGSPWCESRCMPALAPGAGFENHGTTRVLAAGYDARGVWRILPMTVGYNYNGVQYDVEVLSAWDPWTAQWDSNLDQQAFNTDYWLRNVEYSYYTVLPFGTFYFNL